MNIAVMITTKNRRTDLERTLRVLAVMKPPPSEVIVCADGCSDGTVDLVRHSFPWVVLISNPQGVGSVASRDRMVRCARADVVVSLDDDSYPVDERFFGRLPAVMLAHPEAAVVTFPELRDGGQFSNRTMAPESPGRFVPAYANCAAAMWRHVYLEAPGFPGFFFHMYEEPDYALQCYANGYAVWFEPSLVVRHHLSASNRDNLRRHHLNARNELWSVWLRCPWPTLPLVSAYRMWRQFRYALTQGISWVVREPAWWLSALRGAFACLRDRRAVQWRTYYAWLQLTRKPVLDGYALAERFGPRRDARSTLADGP